MRMNGIRWSEKQVSSLRDMETYPQALAFFSGQIGARGDQDSLGWQ